MTNHNLIDELKTKLGFSDSAAFEAVCAPLCTSVDPREEGVRNGDTASFTVVLVDKRFNDRFRIHCEAFPYTSLFEGNTSFGWIIKNSGNPVSNATNPVVDFDNEFVVAFKRNN